MSEKDNSVLKIPAIRFKGFGGEWEEKVFGAVTDIYDGTHQTPKYTNSGVMFLSVENIKNLTSNKFISKESFEKEFKIFPKKNDVLMTRIGDVGTANVVESNVPKAYYVTLALLKYKELDPYFLKNSIASETVRKDIWHRTLHIAFPKKINMNEINKVKILNPISKEEQTKIGNYFQQFDTLIAQHQQKHDKLLNLKKALLEKMFPKKNDELGVMNEKHNSSLSIDHSALNIPEIRFKGFGGEWEEKTLGEFASNISDGDWIESNHIFEQGKYRIIQTGNLGIDGEYIDKEKNAKYFHQKDFDEIRANEIFSGDILISRLAEPAGRTIILPNIGFRMVTAVDVTVIRPDNKFNSIFLKTQLNTANVIRKINENVSGTSHKRISRSNLEKTKLLVPSLNEQTKIGNLFKQLDTLITQHQTQIKKLNNLKQACLEKMFI